MTQAERSPDGLEGKLLVAMPSMGDPRFAHSVIYMCAHSAEGAMGLIVNKPAPELKFAELLESLGITAERPIDGVEVHYGGPVEHGRGFVLHSRDYASGEGTLEVDDHFGMTATLDILEDICLGMGPRAALLALGYAGWGPGQLEGEIRENGWLVCDADEGLVFSADHRGKWNAALERIGVDPRMLSGGGGRA
ncbi:MAG: YqgE/AlgH family protein [Pseudomonadota bacterium]